mgnify:CR=1 FL=1
MLILRIHFQYYSSAGYRMSSGNTVNKTQPIQLDCEYCYAAHEK